MNQKFHIWALILFCLPCLAFADLVRPSPTDLEINLGPNVEVLEDTEGQLTIEQVSTSFSNRFVPSKTANPSFGFSSSVYWLRFTVDASSIASQRWYIVQRHPIVDHLTLYTPVTDELYVPTEMGDALPFSQRILEHREFIFPLNTQRRGEQTYYLKVSGKGALTLELKLSSAEGLIERTYQEQLIFGLFYGALLVMLIYNLLLYFSVRDVAYLWYIMFLAAFILCFVNINGLGLQYFWRNSPRLNEGYPVFAIFGMIALVQYSRAFLSLREKFYHYEKYLRRVLYGFLACFFAVWILPAPWSYHLGSLVVLITACSLTWIGFGTWLRGYRAARFYVAAWSLFLAGCLFFFLDNAGALPHTNWGNYSPHIGSGWAAVFLSLALGERIKLLEAERDQLEQKNHETLQRHFDDVQRLDKDKLVFLDYLSHELNTPLNWLASAQMLEAGKLPPELEEAVSMVHKGQDRLQRLVSVSLRYFDLASRKEKPELVQSAPMWKLDRIMRVPEREEQMAARNIRLVNAIPADLCVQANDNELTEVMSLVLDNAIQFSSEDSEIVAGVRYEEDGTNVVVRIADSGRGIAQENLSAIFEPFFMVGSHHQVEGFGLSLPMAKVMMEQAGAEIWAESEGRGKGATLCLRMNVLKA